MNYAQALRDSAARIEVDGTPSQVGLSPHELRCVADEIERLLFCEAVVTLLDDRIAALRDAVRSVADEIGSRGLIDLADELRLAVR